MEQDKSTYIKSKIDELLGLTIDDTRADQLAEFYEMIIEKNKVMNLTAITDFEEFVVKHFVDSLSIIKISSIKECFQKSVSETSDIVNPDTEINIIDIGTGAGFPGIVIKIFFPHLKMVLVDSLNKRIKFLSVVCEELDLSDVVLVHGRAEEFAKENRNSFDVVTARAVSSFNVLLEYSIPIVKNNKFFVAMRGNDDSMTGINALKILNSKIVKKECFNLPYENSSRSIILVKKFGFSDLKYPRKNSEIKKNPL